MLCMFNASFVEAATTGNSATGLSKGLVGWWTLDGKDTNWATGSVTDKSGNGLTASVVNMGTSTSPIAGPVGQALKFGGASYLKLKTGSIIGSNTDFTISMWVKATASSWSSMTQNPLYTEEADNVSQHVANYFYINGSQTGQCNNNTASPGQVSFAQFTPSDGDFCSISVLSLNKWYYITYTQQGTSRKIYINGKLDVSDSLAETYTGGTIAASRLGTYVSGGRYFPGQIDDVRIYNRALSASEVKQLFNQGSANIASSPTGINSGLIGWWTLDGKDTNWQTNNTNDLSGQNRNGTITNISTTTGVVSGVVGQSFKFNGSSSYVKTSSFPGLNSGHTVSVWVYFNNTSGVQAIWSKSGVGGGGAPTDGGHLALGWLGATGEIVWDWGGANTTHHTTGLGLQPKKWYNIVFRIDNNGNIAMFINNVKQSLNSSSDSLPLNTSGPLYIGADNGNTDFFNGQIDDLRMYNRVLSDTEIAQIYNQGSSKFASSPTSISSSLAGWWTFDGKDTSWRTNTTNDLSGNGNTGTLTNLSTSSSALAGALGQALKFNGTTQSVKITNNSNLNFTTNNFAISAWIYPTGIPALNAAAYKASIFDRWDHACTGHGYAFFLENTQWFDARTTLGFAINCGGNLGVEYSIGADNKLVNNKWQHVVVVVSGNTSTFYVNGVAYPGYALTQTPTTYNGPAYIGNSISNIAPFPGNIDDVRVYSRALTGSEVTQLYNAGR